MPPITTSRTLRLALALALTVAALPARPGAQDKPVIRTEVQQIFVPVSVASQAGEPVTNLTRKDFHLFEDGVEQEIVNCAQEEVPLNVVFLMDISHSTFMELGAIKNAVRAFVRELQPEDRVAIVTFNNEARLILDWSNDLVRLDRALERVVPKGSTVWYDALYVTYNELLPAVRGKKVIVSVTDGWDTASLVEYPDILRKATSSDTQVYVVSKTAGIRDYAEYYKREYGLNYDETRIMKIMYAADSQLKKLAFETGGRVIDPRDAGTLDDVYRRLVRELRQQYYLSYTPYNILRDGQYRKIVVRVDRVGLRVSHRPGYEAR
jgi:Ca-activated chloride channel family protein